MTPRQHRAPVLGSAGAPPRYRRLRRGWSYAQWSDPAEFSSAAKDELYATLTVLSTKACGGVDMAPYWKDRRESGFFERITTFALLLDPAGEVAGWTGYHRQAFGGVNCLYLDSTGVIPESQGGGLMGYVLTRMVFSECLRSAPRPVYLVARTVTPVVYRGLRNACGTEAIWPRPGTSLPPLVSRIGADAAAWLEQADRFDPRTLHLRGAYDNLDADYDGLPTCGDPSVDGFFRDTLRPEDAYIVIARAQILRGVQQWVKREIRAVRAGLTRP